MTAASQSGIEPFYPGLFEVAAASSGLPQLIASHCCHCDRNAYPLKRYCSFCSSADQSKILLSGKGRIYAFTHVERPPKSAAGPYVAAYIDMDESVRLFGKIDADPGTLKIGDQVQAVFGTLLGSVPERLGYWFIACAMEDL